ncbi:hypothetical protein ACEZ3G_12790 [Maribacter algicola]|uniref:Uncharacterized protein n=1 Tax=Meishania litoralis TaxID=3434685 RepID=A0ACC7LM92_9FLAO
MNSEVADILKGMVIIPIGLAIILVPFSILIGWNVVTLFLFWFILIPGVIIYLPTKVSSKKHHLFKSLAGLVVFYAIMIFMIYEHYKTDYFSVMIISSIINLISIFVFAWANGKQIRVD